MLKLIGFSLLIFMLSTIGCAQVEKGITAQANINQSSKADEPMKVTTCQVENDPASYNHKLIEVTAFVSHGFENFTLFDPNCTSEQGIWLEYGGTNASGTMYCCGVTSERSRPKKLVIENIPISLVVDENFRALDNIFRKSPDSIIRATIIGRFFSGKKIEYPKTTLWGGFGHMGCCTLLAIEKIAEVDSQNRDDLDYGASADQPDVKAGGSYEFLSDGESSKELIEAQQKAQSGEREWSFSDPQRVAAEVFARNSKVDEKSVVGIKQIRQAKGRFVYQWRNKATKVEYMVVVSRPYWLSFYANDSKKIAWVVIASYKIT